VTYVSCQSLQVDLPWSPIWSSDVISILFQPVVGDAKWFDDGDLGTLARCRSSTNDAPCKLSANLARNSSPNLLN
jgi:hypothetical protein